LQNRVEGRRLFVEDLRKCYVHVELPVVVLGATTSPLEQP